MLRTLHYIIWSQLVATIKEKVCFACSVGTAVGVVEGQG